MIDYVGNGAPTVPVPPRGALYYDQVDGILYGSVPNVGQWFIIGGGGAGISVPVIQSSLQAINTTSVNSISSVSSKTTLYNVSIYLKSKGTAAVGHIVTVTITYVAADGSGVQTISDILPLDVATVIMETYPILVLGGTAITVSGAYGGGAINDPFTASVRVVEMP